MACEICNTRREKRYCPGVQGEICPICCGTQREETIDCPLNCQYLQLAHQHENLQDAANMPNRDVPISRDFIKQNAHLLTVVQQVLLKAALTGKGVDSDVREALDALVRTYQTFGTGLYYESRPSNLIAAAIFDSVQQQVSAMRKIEAERGLHKLHDSQLLTIFVFLQQMEYVLDNGRKKGRKFLETLMLTVAHLEPPEKPERSSLIIS